MGKSYKRILLLGIGFILCGTLAAQEQKQDSTEGKNNIKASEYLMPKRKGAEKFHSKRGSEHLFFSVGSGIGYLFNVGGGQTAHGPRASFMAGNWLTPVIGLRAGGEYTQWKQGNTNMHLAGANVQGIRHFATRLAGVRGDAAVLLAAQAIRAVVYSANNRFGQSALLVWQYAAAAVIG